MDNQDNNRPSAEFTDDGGNLLLRVTACSEGGPNGVVFALEGPVAADEEACAAFYELLFLRYFAKAAEKCARKTPPPAIYIERLRNENAPEARHITLSVMQEDLRPELSLSPTEMVAVATELLQELQDIKRRQPFNRTLEIALQSEDACCRASLFLSHNESFVLDSNWQQFLSQYRNNGASKQPPAPECRPQPERWDPEEREYCLPGAKTPFAESARDASSGPETAAERKTRLWEKLAKSIPDSAEKLFGAGRVPAALKNSDRYHHFRFELLDEISSQIAELEPWFSDRESTFHKHAALFGPKPPHTLQDAYGLFYDTVDKHLTPYLASQYKEVEDAKLSPLRINMDRITDTAFLCLPNTSRRLLPTLRRQHMRCEESSMALS